MHRLRRRRIVGCLCGASARMPVTDEIGQLGLCPRSEIARSRDDLQMYSLHFWKIVGIDQLPCSEDVDLMCPYRAHVIKSQHQVEQQKSVWRHFRIIEYECA